MRILTGDRPSGKLHLGHYVGSLKNRLFYQDKYEQYVIIADVQALSANFKNPEILKESIFQITCDYLAVGIDPKKTTIFIQSMIPEIAELTVFFMNLVTIARLQRNPTVKTELESKKHIGSPSVGFVTHPISQAADILIFRPNLVPVGEDQKPMVEQTNEIARSFNSTYNTKLFNDVEAIIPKTGGRLPGIDGKEKMSKSLNNAIYLSDNSEQIKEKVMKMYTDPGHIKVSDPGKVEGNTVFEYLDIFDKNKEEIEELKKQYRKGGLGDVPLKMRLFETLNSFIKPIREKRKEFEANKKQIEEILKEGTVRAKRFAKNTTNMVKETMKLKYFS